MTDRVRKARLVLKVAILAVLGGIVGAFVGCTGLAGPRAGYVAQVGEFPLPHHIPKYPGGVSLRFAMVHDVLHERFPFHGRAYYTERNRRVRRALDADKTKTAPSQQPSEASWDRRFALLDDLGVGLERLGRHEEAVRLLRDKLRQQQARGQTGRRLYTTYANLGTFLIHGNFQAARTDPAARERLREGLGFIRQSIEVNPQAHFGREVWQAVAVEFFLTAMEHPALLQKYDFVGDGLAERVDPGETDSMHDAEGWGRFGANRDAVAYLAGDNRRFDADRFRSHITLIGAEGGWQDSVKSAHREPVPFDEPTLGIIGMWRLGGGANPHFALALGEIMMRVGQRYIAWSAYERAVQMQDRFWPDPDVRRKFVAHCRARQAAIEYELPAHELADLRPRFEAESDHGRRYQQAYQQYEAKRIREGMSIDDPHFYDTFDKEHGPIATLPGREDKFVARSGDFVVPPPSWPCVLLFAGLFAFVAAWWMRPV